MVKGKELKRITKELNKLRLICNKHKDFCKMMVVCEKDYRELKEGRQNTLIEVLRKWNELNKERDIRCMPLKLSVDFEEYLEKELEVVLKTNKKEICISCEKRASLKNNSLCSSCAQDHYIENMVDDHERRIKKLEKGEE